VPRPASTFTKHPEAPVAWIRTPYRKQRPPNESSPILPDCDFVFVHVKGTDVASHDGNPDPKIAVIEKIDAMVGHLMDHVDISETYIAVTADHTTSISQQDHTGDPVPVAIHGPEVRSDTVKSYSERSCAEGGLGRIRGKDLMPILLNFQGKVKLYGS